MTASPIPPEQASFTSPIVDCEPPPEPLGRRHPTQLRPSGGKSPQPRAAVHRRIPRRHVAVPPRSAIQEPAPPRAAVVFAEAALRRVLEVVDRRRPVAQLRPLLAPPLIDTVIALTRAPHTAAAALRRVRLRVVDGEVAAAEVFATYTRGRRVRAIAARVQWTPADDRWRIVALQIG